MVERAQRVTNVVEQRHHHIFLVAPIAMRARSGLQAMLEPVDGKAAIIAAQQFQMIEDALAVLRRKFLLLARDDIPIFLCAVDHRTEGCVIVHHVGHGWLSHISAASLCVSLRYATLFSRRYSTA